MPVVVLFQLTRVMTMAMAMWNARSHQDSGWVLQISLAAMTVMTVMERCIHWPGIVYGQYNDHKHVVFATGAPADETDDDGDMQVEC